jgi:hypothetical protein
MKTQSQVPSGRPKYNLRYHVVVLYDYVFRFTCGPDNDPEQLGLHFLKSLKLARATATKADNLRHPLHGHYP